MALSQRERWFIAAGAATAGVLLFFQYVHAPLLTRRADAQERSERLQHELTSSQVKLKREGNPKDRLAEVAAKEKLVDARVPGKNSASLLVWYLSEAEAKSGARIKGIAVGERKEVEVGAPGGPVPLTAIPLTIQVDAPFAGHLLFQQALESAPLLLSMRGLAIERDEKGQAAQITRALEAGNTRLRAEILRGSPVVGGEYKVDLYFKAASAGPDTKPMNFDESAGRTDPFALDLDPSLQGLLKAP